MRNKCKELIKSEKGEFSYVYAAVLIIAILMISSFVWTYTSMMTTIRESKNSAIVGLRYVQSYEALETVMSGRGGRRNHYTDKTLTDTAAYTQFIEAYTLNTGVVQDGSGTEFYSLTDTGTENYHISSPELEAKLSDDHTIITFTAEYTLSLPIRFMGETVTYLNVPMKESLSTQISAITNS